jgi:hypothetical protein
MDDNSNINDEPVYADTLGHHELIYHLLKTLLECHPPYVIGVSGSWGAGKTSFLRKVWALMGGKFPETRGGNDEAKNDKKRLECCQELLDKNGNSNNGNSNNSCRYDQLRNDWKTKTRTTIEPSTKKHGFSHWQVIWFNPWQHQFENNPLIALLHEIRAQYNPKSKVKGELGKYAHVATDAIFEMLINAADSLSLGLVPKLDFDKIRQKGERYESQRLETALTSQTFSAYFEEAVNTIVDGNDNGRLLICIDDLDRCQGDVAYRLLESLKLYLNARNCIFILGMDQKHLEENLPPFKDKPRAARDYLDKMLQDRFVLPVPTDMKVYISGLLEKREIPPTTASALFNGVTRDDVTNTLNDNLPHNPRKIKLFLAAWQRYLDIISKQSASQNLDWRITVILCYLAVFEEPIYRSIELAPEKFADELIKFVDGLHTPTTNDDTVYKGLALPPKLPVSGGMSGSSMTNNSHHYFWISPLIKEIVPSAPTATIIRLHLIDSRIQP